MKDTIKHTPGPWSKVEDDADLDGTAYFSIIGPEPGYEFVTGNATSADAALIAAAPELLEICQKMFAEIVWGALDAELVEKLNAVIAKATGGRS